MRLSVIVVSWKVPELLRQCLKSLLAQTALPADDWEVFVVDNFSGDGSVEMVKEEFPQVRVVANADNRGFARANNQAFAMCRGRAVLLLNPDTVVLDGAVTRLLEQLEQNPDWGAAGCQLLNSDRSFQRWTGGALPGLGNVFCNFMLLYRLLPRQLLPSPIYLEHKPVTNCEVGWVSGACLMLRREALGGHLFDERFFLYGEDLDLCRRIGSGGWKILYCPAISIMHHEGKSLASMPLEFQASKLLGLRKAFSVDHGPAALLAYDVVALGGFLLRYLIVFCAASLRLTRMEEARQQTLAEYIRLSFRTLVHRNLAA